jgi:short-subunit dehydrogenase
MDKNFSHYNRKESKYNMTYVLIIGASSDLAKAALTAYLSGLRNSLIGAQIHVMTVKSGIIDTIMTKGMELTERLTV